jgi:hypothetical protein
MSFLYAVRSYHCDKIILFDVRPSKNKGVTSNTQKITTKFAEIVL